MFEATAAGRPQPLPAKSEGPPIEVLLAAPRGFCAGVRRAIDAVLDALEHHGAPVYVRRPIVHNLAVVRALEAEGAVFVEELEQVPDGAVVLLSAHGVSPGIAQEAARRDLVVYDAVCPLVAKVHREVERHDRTSRQIVLVGHRGHPEVEGTFGRVRRAAGFVVASPDEVAQLPADPRLPTAYAVQTTYAVEEAEQVIAALRERFELLAGPPSSDICYATSNRQWAVDAIAAECEVVLVVGDTLSSNAKRLAEVAAARCRQVQLVSGPDDVAWCRLEGARTIGVSAAASTPETSVQAVLDALSARFTVRAREVTTAREDVVFKPLPIG